MAELTVNGKSVTVDDSFLSLSPQQQEATVNEIAASMPKAAPTPKAPSPQQPATPVPEAPLKDPVSGRTLADEEKAFQAQQARNTGAPKPKVKPPVQPKKPEGPGFATRQLAQVNEGLAEGLGAPVDAANWLIGKVTGYKSDKPFLGSESIKSGLRSIGAGVSPKYAKAFAPQSKAEQYTQAASRSVGANVPYMLAPVAAGGRMMAREATQVAPKVLPKVAGATNPTLAVAAKEGGKRFLKDTAKAAVKRPGVWAATEIAGASGAGAGQQLGQDIAPDNPYVQLGTSIAGGMAGGLAGGKFAMDPKGTTKAVVKGTGKAIKAPVTAYDQTLGTGRFVRNQIKNNPNAAHLAEIVDDLDRVVKNTARSDMDPKGRAVLTVKEINNLEKGYQSQFRDAVTKLDLPEAEKVRLREALDRQHSIGQEELSNLRGTVAGDAVADSITKIQVLRQNTKEIARRSGYSYLADAAGAVVGTSLTANPLVGSAVGGLASRVAQKAARKFLSKPGDLEAARVHSAERLLKKREAFKRISEKVGPSGQRESQKALMDEYIAAREAGKGGKGQGAQGRTPLVWTPQMKATMPKSAQEGLNRLAAGNINPEAPPVVPVIPPLPKLSPSLQGVNDRLATVRDLGDFPSTAPRDLANVPRNPNPTTAAAVAPEVPKVPLPTLSRTAKSINKDLQALGTYGSFPTPPRNALKNVPTNPDAPKPVKVAPEKPPKPPKALKPLPPEQQAIEDNIARGVKGDSNIQNAIAKRVGEGVTPDHVVSVLDKIEGRYPQLAGEINRLRHNWATQKRNSLNGVIPAIREELANNGTMSSIAKAAEEAASKAKVKPEAKAATPKESPISKAMEQQPSAEEPSVSTTPIGKVLERPNNVPEFDLETGEVFVGWGKDENGAYYPRYGDLGSPDVVTQPIDSNGKPIKNIEAYNRAASGNQSAINQAIDRVQRNSTLPAPVREAASTALAAIRSAGSKANAMAIVDEALKGIPKEFHEEIKAALVPMAAQFKK